MTESSSIKRFTIILSIGTILALLGKLPYKFIALNILNGGDYSLFSLTLSTFNLIIPISGLQLHSPFTRELRISINKSDVKNSFALTYLITSGIGFISMILMGILFLKSS
jgi:O-antigen/teichoic acid export membrane protein